MLIKYLENKVELEPIDCLTVAKEPVELEYYLIESEINGEEELDGKTVFGIEIVKRVNDIRVESSIIKDVSCLREDTLRILRIMARNTVTPISLPFIIEDIINT